MDLKRLSKPFPAKDIEWRIGRSGAKNGKVWAVALAYLTSREIGARLDEVVGPENWRNSFREYKGGTICQLEVKVGDEWVLKEGGSDESNFEAYKGELSGAVKRAGVAWGIGRYLYKFDEMFVETSLQKRQGWNYQSANKKKNIPAFYWKSPALPAWALPVDPEAKRIEKVIQVEFEKPEPPPEQEEVDAMVGQSRPYSAETLKAKFVNALTDYKGISPTYQVVASQLGKLLPEQIDRYAFTRYLTGNEGGSTKALSNPQLFAFSVWMHGNGGLRFNTEVNSVCKQEAQNVLKAVMTEQGQQTMGLGKDSDKRDEAMPVESRSDGLFKT